MKNESKESNNKELLLEHARSLITILVSKQSEDSVPPEIKLICNYISELAISKFTMEQKYKLLGSFFITWFIIPALNKPDDYGLFDFRSKGSHPLTDRSRRNLYLISRILQNLASGSEFTNSEESYFQYFNTFIKANRSRIDQFLKDISYSPPLVLETVPSAPMNESVLQYLTRLFESSAPLLCSFFKDEEIVVKFRSLISKLSKQRGLNQLIDYIKEKEEKIPRPMKMTISVEIDGKTFDHIIEGNSELADPIYSSVVQSLEKSLQDVQTIRADYSVFGKTLVSLMNAQKMKSKDLEIPEIVHQAIQVLLLKGLGQSNLFEGVGSREQQKVVSELKKRINAGNSVDLMKYSIREVALLLKLFLRKLPEPLFENHLMLWYADLTEADILRDKVKKGVHSLPSPNKHMLYALFRLFFNFHINFHVNNFDYEHTSASFAPSIWSSSEKPDKRRMEVMFKYLMTNFDDIFSEYASGDSSKGPIFKARLLGHGSEVQSIVSSEDNKFVFSCSYDDQNSIRIWNAEEYRSEGVVSDLEMREILCMIRVGEQLWCATTNDIVIWSIKHKSYVTILHKNMGASSIAHVGSVVWANSLKDNTIYVYDIKSFGEKYFSFKPPSNVMITLLRGIGDQVWAATSNFSLIIWDAVSHKIIREISGAHSNKIRSIVKVNENFIWTGGEDGMIHVWKYQVKIPLKLNSQNSQLVKKIEAHNGKIKQIVPFQGKVYSCSWDCLIRVWNAESFELEEEYKGYFSTAVSDIAFVHNPKKHVWTLWASSYDKCVVVWELQTDDRMARRNVYRSFTTSKINYSQSVSTNSNSKLSSSAK